MNHDLENCPITLNTIRICANNPIDVSIEVSRIGFTNMKPNAVILVNKNDIFCGLAATSLVHFPINAALLVIDGDHLKKDTLNEIKRLSPKGYQGIHVILIGNISKDVLSELNEHGFKTFHVAGKNHYETACMIPRLREEFKNVLIVSGEYYSEGIAAPYWSAHHGDPILFVQKNSIPYCTLEAIKKMNDINIYIIGSTKTISEAVENYLSQLNNVTHLKRIDGENPYEIVVNFAKYKDSETEFGWGRDYKDGHAFTFGKLNHPMEIISGVLFAHMGKHTPLLLARKDMMPEVVERYILSVKPMPAKNMPSPPFMHGFILGSAKNISYDVQLMIENTLSIDHEMNDDMMYMNNNHDMMGMHHEMMDTGNQMMDMHHEIMGTDNQMMDMNMNNNQGTMGMHNEMMDADNQMMNMHHEMMDTDYKMINMSNKDMMKHSHHMHHMDNDEDHEDTDYHMHKMHHHEDDDDYDEEDEEIHHDSNNKMNRQCTFKHSIFK